MSDSMVFAPQLGVAAEWVFRPSDKLLKDYGDDAIISMGMDCQNGEVLSLVPISTDMKKGRLVVVTSQGDVELIEFEDKWKRGEIEDSIVWDIERIVNYWAYDE